MNDAPDRLLVDWLMAGPDQGPRHGLERALAATRRTPQRPGWTFPGRQRVMLDVPAEPRGRQLRIGTRPLQYIVVAALAVVSVAAVFGLATNPSGIGSPTSPTQVAPAPTPEPSPSPSATPTPAPSPGYGSVPPGWPSPEPFAPATPLPDPAGSPVPSDLIDRQYNTNPIDIQGDQALVLTLRAADDPHCVAMYGGRSTCFTILWTPNYPSHVNDPAVRGPARLVGGNLVLGFALVPDDPACESTSSTYAISPDGWTLSGVDVPSCSFSGFVRH